MSWAHTDAMKHLNKFELAVRERLIAESHGVLVGYDCENGQTVPLPDALKERLR